MGGLLTEIQISLIRKEWNQRFTRKNRDRFVTVQR